MARAIVVGAGVYGQGIALELAGAGCDVTVCDPRPDDDVRRASGGITRVLRVEYGAASHFTELTLLARERWRELERRTGRELYRETGVLMIVPQGADGAWERESLRVTGELGCAGEAIDAGELVARRPSIRSAGIDWAIDNPVGGFLWAHRATATLAGLAGAAGVRRVHGRVVAADAGSATLDDGRRLEADVVVIAAGAWSARLAPVPVVATRQLTAYLAGGPADVPVFGEGAPFAMYGMPAHEGYGLKVGCHVTAAPGDPDDPWQRVPTAQDTDAIVDYARRRFGLDAAQARVARADVCFYAMTPTEDPIVDRLPDGRVVCTGFSGHGFKFAPVVAAAAARLALGCDPGIDLAPFRSPAG